MINSVAGRRILLVLAIITHSPISGQAGGFPAASAGDGIYKQKIRTFHSFSDFEKLTAGKVKLHRGPAWKLPDGSLLKGTGKGLLQQEASGTWSPYTVRPLPWSEITVVAKDPVGAVWLGTPRGAIRLDPSPEARSQFFAGKRWLPADAVSGIGFENCGNSSCVWIETSSGLSRIEFRPISLADKAAYFEDRIRSRHMRQGLTADSHLSVPGDVSSNKTVSSDNDGLWTAMYVAAECFRYRVTGDKAARENARIGFEAIIRLEAITGIPGFPARSFIEVGKDIQPEDGEWHLTPDGKWKWKGDTSSDEIVGHYLAFALYYDLAAAEEEKPKIRALVDRITSYIVDNGYRLLDTDGKPTMWGWWGPSDIWTDPDETGLRALHILSHLSVAYHITGNPKYREASSDLVKNHKYALLTRNQKINLPGRVNHSDDELAFLSYYPLLRYETDAELKKIYIESLQRSWQCERGEANPLWDFIYAAGTGDSQFDSSAAVTTLRDIPWDTITWTAINSFRQDVTLDQIFDRHARRQSALALPADERPALKWNANPYQLDGGNGGRSEDDGAFFLLPYWMGRFHNYIRE
jgi:hypothetical protein